MWCTKLEIINLNHDEMKKLVLVALVVMGSILSSMAIDVIPKPKHYSVNGQEFSLNPEVKIIHSDELKDLAMFLSESLSPATGWDLEVELGKKSRKQSIYLSIDESLLNNEEAYSLNVLENSIEIKGHSKAGVFYGIQTLLQLMPVEIYNKQRQKQIAWKIPGVEISDEPEYEWRGLMLDVSRYFFEKDYVLHLLDMMAMYKMNVMHLHLIDDAGWRLEIKKYPKLTSIGGFRGENENRTGGYYTQEDVKEMVAYAALRNIEIIPEIEVPAHTLAAISAYPFLSCTEKDYKVPEKHFISRDLYCVGKESTFEFLEDVFEETFKLFPSKYIHIGGDEAKYDRWRECPHCQKRKKDLGLKNEAELQVYFTNRVQKMVKKYGKTIVGWDEMLEKGLQDKAVGMVWHDKKKAISGTRDGHDIVMALTDYCYFDVAESKSPGEIKAATWLAPISFEKVYEFNPMIKGLAPEHRSQVLGGQATLWSDQFIHGTLLQELAPLNENRSEKYFDYLTLPRMTALSEALWSSDPSREWEEFENRMSTHYNRFDQADYGYRVPEPKLIGKEMVDDGFKISLKNVVEGAEIRYSIDGEYPNTYSTIYTKPVFVNKLSDFRAITVVNRKQFSLPLYFNEKYEAYKKHGQFLGEWKPSSIKGKKYSVLELNATGKIDANGSYELSFLFTEGKFKLEISSVEVYKNGAKVADDIHFAYTGNSSKDNKYKFKIDCYETGAAFAIKAKVRGDLGADSNGVIFIKKN